MVCKIKILLLLLMLMLSVNSTRNKRKNHKTLKVVGGTNVEIRNFPHQVSLQQFGQHYCGGALIKSNYVISSVHCAPWDSLYQFTVKAGMTSVSSSGVSMPIQMFYKHPKYSSVNQDYDALLIQLQYPFQLSDVIQTIPLAFAPPPDNAYAVVSGWGRTSENGPISDHLQAVAVPVLNSFVCTQRYAYVGYTDRMICAGNWALGGQDACQGDSGGPLIYNGQLVGIVSWGIGCARAYYPGVYTNIANWEIQEYIYRKTMY